MREEQNRKEKRRKNKSLFDTTKKNHKLSKIKNIFKYEKLTPYFK
jgi:hypothetical protein